MAGPEGTSTVRLAKDTSVPRAHQGTEDNCSERLFGSTNNQIRIYLSIPQPEHTPGGSVRGGARRDSGAGRARVAQEADNGTVRPGDNKHYYSPDDGRMTSRVCSGRTNNGNPM